MVCLKFLEWSNSNNFPFSKTSFEKVSKMSSSSLHNLPEYEELYPDDGNPPTYSGFQIHKLWNINDIKYYKFYLSKLMLTLPVVIRLFIVAV